jgi:uncharacterized membrane protein
MKKLFSSIENKNAAVSFSIRHWIWISCAFSLLLLIARIITSARFSYAFLAWNLFLAYIPFAISTRIRSDEPRVRNRAKMVGLILVWILFMPNCFYILTDLFHLRMENGHPWFDLTLILSFAWNGMLMGILSIRDMEMLLRQRKGKVVSNVMICAIIWLNAFGVYIGRFLRFNSWDVITNPLSLFGNIADMIFDPYAYRYAWTMSFCFAFFMIIVYYTVKNLAETFNNN